jgi:uncharacterized membrane protein
MNFFQQIADLTGFSVCHQLPERSMLLGNIFMPVCCRCSGIYTGFFISIFILFLMHRKRQSGMPPLYIIIISCFFIVSTFADGLFSYFGIYETNNIIRMVTGYLSGSGIAVVIFPIFIFQYYRVSEKIKIFGTYQFYIFFIIITLGAITSQVLLFLFKPAFFALFYYYFNFFCVIFTYWFSNLALTLLIPIFGQKAEKLFGKNLVFPLLLSAALSFIELFISSKLHVWLQRF